MNDEGLWRIGYATSHDGITWTRYVPDPVDKYCPGVTGPGCIFGSRGGAAYVLIDPYAPSDERYKMWYESGAIRYATSPNGIDWTIYPVNNGCVLDLGNNGTWDQFEMGLPVVVKTSDTLYEMWYMGFVGKDQDGYPVDMRIGYATSHDGINWTKYPGNNCDGKVGDGCIFDKGTKWESYAVSDPSVIVAADRVLMWYAGRISIHGMTQIGFAYYFYDDFDTCSNLPVRIVGGSSYLTLQSAYDAAYDGDIIQSQAGYFIQNLDANRNISVTVDGGYDCSNTTKIGNTILKGNMTVSDGTVTIGSFELQ